MWCLVFFCVFFFFKQKTAYEVRISDWSSDVCSSDLIDGFTKRHGVKSLVYFEVLDSIEPAIRREKSLKRWARPWKIALIERDNQQWIDLWNGQIGRASCRERVCQYV